MTIWQKWMKKVVGWNQHINCQRKIVNLRDPFCTFTKTPIFLISILSVDTRLKNTSPLCILMPQIIPLSIQIIQSVFFFCNSFHPNRMFIIKGELKVYVLGPLSSSAGLHQPTHTLPCCWCSLHLANGQGLWAPQLWHPNLVDNFELIVYATTPTIFRPFSMCVLLPWWLTPMLRASKYNFGIN